MRRRNINAFVPLVVIIMLVAPTVISSSPVDFDRPVYHEQNVLGCDDPVDFPEDADFVPGEILVKFKEGVSPGEMSNVHSHFGTTVKKEYARPDFQVVSIPEGIDVMDILDRYLRDPLVEYAEPNYLFRLSVVPNDTNYSLQWAHQKIFSESAWDFETGDPNVVIAIIDTGVDMTHPDLDGKIWANPGELPGDGTDNDNNGYVDDVNGWNFWADDNYVMDEYGHGTHCAGIAAAETNNNEGIAGMAWDCRIMIVKLSNYFGSLTTDRIVEGIVYATNNGADVISMSFSGPYTDTVKTAVEQAFYNDVVLVAAAGNNNLDNPRYPASYNSVISVSATDDNDAIAPFSGYGAGIDVSAPGVEILSTMPTYDVRMTTDFGYSTWYDTMNGTSMATPLVAGLCGLVRSHNSSLINEEVRQIVQQTSDDIGSAGWDQYFGWGRINASSALQADTRPVAFVSSPEPFSIARDVIDIEGWAYCTAPSFANFSVEIGEGVTPSSWTLLNYSSSELQNGTLATWDTSTVSEGEWTIRLTTCSSDGKKGEDRICVTVDNVYITTPYYYETFGHDPVEITGRANATNLQYYRLEYAHETTPDMWNFIMQSSSPVVDGTLGYWNITPVTSGRYIIRLTLNATDHDSNESINVVIDKSLLPGWPQRTGDRIDISSPVLVDLDLDGFQEVVVGSTDGQIYVWHHNGTLYNGWPQATTFNLFASPAAADLDGDGDLEVVIRSYNTLYVWHHDGTLLPGWPSAIPEGTGWGSPAISDLDNDGALEIIISADWLYGMEGRIFVYDITGTVTLTISTADRTYSSPSVGDIDGDGDKEIVCGWRDATVYAWHHDGVVVAGWPQICDEAICDSPKLADLDGNGACEVISRGWQWVYVWSGNGMLLPGWPVQARGGHTNSGIGNIDDDSELEIVIASYDRMYAWNMDGTDVPGFPQFFTLIQDTLVIPHWGGSGAILGDIDGDSDIEIIGSTCHSEGALDTLAKLFAWHHDGTPVAGWPKLLSPRIDIFPTAVRSTSALGDVDSDGDIDIAVGGEDGKLYIWDLSGAYNPDNIEWGMFQHDPSHTGNSGTDNIPPARIIDLVAVPAFNPGEVNLTWTAPGDDGNNGTADHYIMKYNTVPIDHTNWGISTDVPNEPAPSPAGNVESMAVTGLTGGVEYWFAVIAVDDNGNPSPISNSPNATPTLFIWNLDLSAGWNLISFPTPQSDTTLSTVLSSIAGDYDQVQYYNASTPADHWKTYNANRPVSLNDLADLQNHMGFWINITASTQLQMEGQLPSSTAIDLKAGWNLVGYPTLTERSITDALAGTGYDQPVETSNATAPYRIGPLADTYMMKPGEGYWVHVPVDTVWVVDW